MSDIPPHIQRNIEMMARNAAAKVWASMTWRQRFRVILDSVFRR